MPNQKAVLIFYSYSSRKALIEDFNREDSSLRLLLHYVDPARSVEDQLIEIRKRIKELPVTLGGVTGTNDFASALAAIINQEMGFRGPSLLSIYQAQHKALFAQHAAACNSHYPVTRVLRSAEDIPKEGSWYPVFIKPVAGSLSFAAFEAENPIQAVEQYTHLAGQPRQDVLWRERIYKAIRQPANPALSTFLIQPFLSLPQYTVDGCVFEGQVHWVGITASIFDQAGHSFERFDFPASLSEKTVSELEREVEALIRRIGYKQSCFNVEFFVTHQGHVILIEFNTRQSFQFVPLFTAQYTNNYFLESCRLAVGERPRLEPVPSPWMASSCVLRLYQDAEVICVPSQVEIQAVIEDGLAHSVRVMAQPGKRLSDYKQDQYSYRYALINIMGKDTHEIGSKLSTIKNKLTFEFQ